MHSTATGFSGDLTVNLPVLGKGDYFELDGQLLSRRHPLHQRRRERGGDTGSVYDVALNCGGVTDATGANMQLTKQFSVWAG